MAADATTRCWPRRTGRAWSSLIILIPALVFLWGFPGRTADLWAWAIKPEMTPTFMGAGYGAGAFFFFHAFAPSAGIPPPRECSSAAIFATLMLVATLIHWDRFNHGHAPFLAAAVFYGWVAVYILAPVAVGALWFLNQRRDPRRAQPGDPVISQRVRTVALVFGSRRSAPGIVFFVSPDTAIDGWPWKLTPLTARVLASFTVQVGTGALLLSLDPRWSSWRVLLETFLVATALLLIGAIRAWSDFDHADPATWVFVGGLAGAAAAVLVLFRAMNAQAA